MRLPRICTLQDAIKTISQVTAFGNHNSPIELGVNALCVWKAGTSLHPSLGHVRPKILNRGAYGLSEMGDVLMMHGRICEMNVTSQYCDSYVVVKSKILTLQQGV